MQRWLLIAILLAVSSTLTAEERLDLEGTSIIGSNELPQVLIIVPWKKTGMGRIRLPAEISLAKEMLEPIDRAVLYREINYFQAMKAAKTD